MMGGSVFRNQRHDESQGLISPWLVDGRGGASADEGSAQPGQSALGLANLGSLGARSREQKLEYGHVFASFALVAASVSQPHIDNSQPFVAAIVNSGLTAVCRTMQTCRSRSATTSQTPGKPCNPPTRPWIRWTRSAGCAKLPKGLKTRPFAMRAARASHGHGSARCTASPSRGRSKGSARSCEAIPR